MHTTATHWGMYGAIVENGRLKKLVPWSGDTAPSVLGESIPDALGGTSRLRFPVAREGWHRSRLRGDIDKRQRGAEPFVRLSWDEALSLLADELARVREHGNESIYAGSYGWGSPGIFHHPQSQLHRFVNCIGGAIGSVGAYSFAAAEAIVPYVTGYALRPLMWAQTSWSVMARETQLFVAFGGLSAKNSQVSPGGVARHALVGGVQAMLDSGGRLVDIGPVRSDLPASNRIEWAPPRPHSDVALMLGIAHTLASEGLADRTFLQSHCVGYERFESYLFGEDDGVPKCVEWAAKICDLPANWIRALAREMAAKRTMIGLSWSIQRADHGEQAVWTGITLAALLGQIGLPGGGFGIGYGSCNFVGGEGGVVPWATLPKGENPLLDRAIPVARLSDMLLHPGEEFAFNGKIQKYPDIKLVYWVGGNPFHHHQDINKLLRAWRQPETVVVNEPFWNALARHADLVLPTATSFEREDFAATANEEAVVAMHRVSSPLAESKTDHWIFCELASRLGVREKFTEGRTETDWVRHLYEQSCANAKKGKIDLPEFDDFWNAGVVPLPSRPGEERVLWQAFRSDPHANPLATPSGRIEIYSERLASFDLPDCKGHACWFEPREWLGSLLTQQYPLHLISSQPKGRLHGQYDQGKVSRALKVKGREAMSINPFDAQARGIGSGDLVRVFNDRGACLAGAVLSEDVNRGIVQLPVGAWYDPQEPGTVGSLCKHGNPNVLTRDEGSSCLGQGPSAMSCLVDIQKWDGAPPVVTAFNGPRIV